MTTFPSYEPTYSVNKRSEPRVRVVSMGDGYQQRIMFGFNQDPKEWSLTFMLKTVDADIVETFLETQASNGASFEWTPPESTTTVKCTCFSWNRELLGPGFNKLDVTFRQVFEP